MPADPDDDLATKGGLRLPAAALQWRFSRSGGPGGQHVNTSDTRVELVADLTQLEGRPSAVERVRKKLGEHARVVSASERSQHQNRLSARRRLAGRLDAAAARPKPRRPTSPSRGAVEARLREKREAKERKARRRRPGADD